MSVTIITLAARVGEDVYQPIAVDSSYDTSDWSSWALACYLYSSAGTVIITCTEGNGRIVRTSTGHFYFWFKKSDMAIAVGTYFWQCRRIDANEDLVLAEGRFEVKPYAEP